MHSHTAGSGRCIWHMEANRRLKTLLQHWRLPLHWVLEREHKKLGWTQQRRVRKRREKQSWMQKSLSKFPQIFASSRLNLLLNLSKIPGTTHEYLNTENSSKVRKNLDLNSIQLSPFTNLAKCPPKWVIEKTLDHVSCLRLRPPPNSWMGFALLLEYILSDTGRRANQW